MGINGLILRMLNLVKFIGTILSINHCAYLRLSFSISLDIAYGITGYIKKIPRYDTIIENMLTIADTIFNLRPSIRRSFANTPHLNKFLQATGWDWRPARAPNKPKGKRSMKPDLYRKSIRSWMYVGTSIYWITEEFFN